MIRIEVELTEAGNLKALRASGHAAALRGCSVACAAVSALLRTAARYFFEEGFLQEGVAPGPGSMDLRLGDPDGERLRGASGLLLRGLVDLGREFPQDVEVGVRPEG